MIMRPSPRWLALAMATTLALLQCKNSSNGKGSADKANDQSKSGDDDADDDQGSTDESVPPDGAEAPVANAATDAAVFAADAAGLGKLLANRSHTAERLTKLYLQRIEALNRKGPSLHAVIAVNPDAAAQAAALDRARPTGTLPPLWGIPVLIKDNIETKDKVATTAGSLALKDNITGRDAPLVANLRQAGAIILGKANLSQWAGMRGAIGWSATGGQTVNPYDPALSPCGSSAGSAVAVAAGMAPLAVGTETSGSIVCPAAANDLIGIKPTVGLISGRYIVPITARQDTAGPLAKTVADAVALLDVIATSKPAPPYASLLTADSLKGMAVGYIDPEGLPAAEEKIWRQAKTDLRAAGAKLVAVTDNSVDAQACDMLALLLPEMNRDLGAYLKDAPAAAAVHTMAELIAFNAKTTGEQVPADVPDYVADAAQSTAFGPAYNQALAACKRESEDFLAFFKDSNIEVLVTTEGSPYQMLMASYGAPYISIPAGFAGEHRAFSLNIFAPKAQEGALIKAAFGYEQVTKGKHRRDPF